MKPAYKIVVIYVMVLGCQSSLAEPLQVAIEHSVPTITVSGLGKVTVKPDEAIVTLGVSTENTSLQRAYKIHTEDMNAVIQAIKAIGIDSDDIQTTSYRVNPVYSQERNQPRNRLKPIGYRVSHQVNAKVRDLKLLGNVIDAAMKNEMTVFNGIQFASSRKDEIQQEARAKAVLDARDRAEIMAMNLNVKLGRVLKIIESGQAYPMPTQSFMMAEARSMSVPQIEPGTLEIQATCQVIFEILQ